MLLTWGKSHGKTILVKLRTCETRFSSPKRVLCRAAFMMEIVAC